MNKIKNVLPLFLIFLSLFVIYSCERDDIQSLDERNWTLVWSDEFNGASGELPDTLYWNFDIGTGQDGWGNNELQSYTNDTSNIAMDGDGNLLIKALANGTSYTSARINTKNKFSQKYGRFEASIITPYGPGIWPAFWMLGSNIDLVSWPLCGEIDIMELRGQFPHLIHGSLHGPGYSGGNPITGSYALVNDRFDNDYHLFAIEWDEEKIDFFVDGYLYQRVNKEDVPGDWVYNQPFYILLNVAVGGNYVGFPTSETPFPQSMTIDYVRVYKEI